jgi:predicted P-loop ATPase
VIGLRGGPLSEADYAALEKRWIDRTTADNAYLSRVSQQDACAILGRNGRGQYEGLLIPHVWPGTQSVREYAVRRDHPEVENGKPKRKYMAPPGRGNMLYFAPGISAESLESTALPVVLTEGPFKALALHRLSTWHVGEMQPVRFLAAALPGVWNFRGTIGKTVAPDGSRVDEVGVIADFSRLNWKRKVTIVFDQNSKTNESVRAALWTLTRELQARGATVHWFDWPDSTPDEVNGIDDLLFTLGPGPVLELLEHAEERPSRDITWRGLLMLNEDERPRAILHNAVLALSEAPEWRGVFAWDDFQLRAVARIKTPWGHKGIWSDAQDLRTTCWLQQQGLMVNDSITSKAVQQVADLTHFHPVREFLESLDWDEHPRLDTWMIDYLTAEDTEYTRAVSAKWMISAVARIFRPGVKADHVLILEGPQGKGKSRAVSVLGGPFYVEEIADLGTKDSSVQIQGAWIVELSELDALSRSEVSKVKAFISRNTDRFRPPYGRHLIEADRQCVFVGTVNHAAYLRDETGARRFWPVVCTGIDVPGLRKVRNQLWAEAYERFKAGENWWLESAETIETAETEQQERYDDDPWEQRITDWIDGRMDISVDDILTKVLEKPIGQWTQPDKNRVARILTRNGWKRYQKRVGLKRSWLYYNG